MKLPFPSAGASARLPVPIREDLERSLCLCRRAGYDVFGVLMLLWVPAAVLRAIVPGTALAPIFNRLYFPAAARQNFDRAEENLL